MRADRALMDIEEMTTKPYERRRRRAGFRRGITAVAADFNRLPEGGHFAAWEQPEPFVAELRAAFRSLRAPR